MGFVDDEDVRDLQDAGLDHLDTITEVWREHDDGGVRDRGDLELRLADPNGLQDHWVKAESAQQPDRLARRQRQAAEMAARAHATDEHSRIQSVALHADAVAENRATGEWRVGVRRDHGHGTIELSQSRDERVDQSRLAGSRGAREPDDIGWGSVRQGRLESPHRRIAFFDQADSEGKAPNVPGAKSLGE